jgi:hypothetical protein
MPTNTLISLPSFSYTSLDFDSIVSDVKSLIKQHPEYNQIWDDFLESNAGRMFVETMSYVIEKLASRMDWLAQEMYISTATQRQSLINLLELINHTPSLPKASYVGITMALTKWIAPFNLPIREIVSGLDINGNVVNFECIQMADDGKPDYSFVYNVNTGTVSNKILTIVDVPFYQGSTVVDSDVIMNGIDNETILLSQAPVIENSIRVVDSNTGYEFPQVTSFISPEAQSSTYLNNTVTPPVTVGVPPYMVSIDANNNATIVFGPSSLVTICTKGQSLNITYRVGGGANTNIVANAINQTKTYTIGSDRTTVLYTNAAAAYGGADEEDLNQAKLTAPISLRSAEKTVTWEDYVSNLESQSTILHANVVGKENEPPEIYTQYGFSLPPLETWIFVTPNRSNWETIDPYLYNSTLQIERPYAIHDWMDSEDITLTTASTTVYLQKFKRYQGYALYITQQGQLSSASYTEINDYSINPTTGDFTRVATSDNGTIPSPTVSQNVILTVRYVYEDVTDFQTNTVKTFTQTTSGGTPAYTIVLDNTMTQGIYTPYGVKIMNTSGTTTYVEGSDYTIDYTANIVTLISTGNIVQGQTVIVRYANNWVHGQTPNVYDLSEENSILSSISNMKMICVDNLVKDSLYTPFDIVANVYCKKNMRTAVQNGLEPWLRSKYTLDQSNYNTSIMKSSIIGNMMNFNGVNYVEIVYLGKNYDAYRRFILNQITQDTLNALDANTVEFSISALYNEILVLAADEWDGNPIVENQRHGLIFTYSDAS